MDITDKRIKTMGKAVIRKIMEMKGAKNRAHTRSIGFKPFAKWFKTSLGCNDDEFVMVLRFVRKYAPSYYDALDIPPMWNGGAHKSFPHLFLKGEIVKLKALKDLPSFQTDHGEIGPFEKDAFFETKLETATRLVKLGLAEALHVTHDD